MGLNCARLRDGLETIRRANLKDKFLFFFTFLFFPQFKTQSRITGEVIREKEGLT